MSEIAVYWGTALQVGQAAYLLHKHDIACRTEAEKEGYYWPNSSPWAKPNCSVLVPAEQVALAQQVLAPLLLLESRQARRIASRIRWRFVGMALCLAGGGGFTLAAVFGPPSYAIGAVVCFTALLVLLIGASHQSMTKPERED